MVSTPILVFPDLKKEFHVHINVSPVTLGVVLAQLGEGYINHRISFASRKLSIVEKNYISTDREGLDMVYALQNSFHYLSGGHFKKFTNHSML